MITPAGWEVRFAGGETVMEAEAGEPDGPAGPGRNRRGPTRLRRGVLLAAVAAVVLISGAVFLGRAASSPSGHQRPAMAAGPTAAAVIPATATTPATPEPPVPLHPPRGMTQAEIEQRVSATIGRIDDRIGPGDSAFDVAGPDRNAEGQWVYGVTVYRAAADPAALSARYATVAYRGMTISYARALLSYQQERRLDDLVPAEGPALAKLGVQIVEWGGEKFPGGPLQIDYDRDRTAPGPEQLRRFEIFGPGTVYFHPEQAAHLMNPAVGPDGSAS